MSLCFEFRCAGYRHSNHWGGVIIQGLAGHTQCVPDDSVCNAQDSEVGVDDTPIHGLLGYYGGADEADSSGVLRHVVITASGRDYDYDENGTPIHTEFAGLKLHQLEVALTLAMFRYTEMVAKIRMLD